MSYTTFLGSKKIDFAGDAWESFPHTPVYRSKRNLEKYCLDFIRCHCTNMHFSGNAALFEMLDSDELNDEILKSIDIRTYAENLRHDVDRLCLERAIHSFAESGSKNTAFDVYFAFCEIFKPFGRGYDSTRTLLEMLAEHESNASSLLMKHRDHYSHSVYVFMIGIAVFSQNDAVRKAFSEKYFKGKKAGETEINTEFLRLWGTTSLFHDIGYPFEIAHQQVNAYFQKMNFRSDPIYVSYKVNRSGKPEIKSDFLSLCKDEAKYAYDNTDITADSNICISEFFANQICMRYAGKYLCEETQLKTLFDKKTTCSPDYMDHAYFSGIIMLKKMVENGITLDNKILDVITAIILHNSLFRFFINKDIKRPLELNDEQPLAWLLMLCDELQCWDRAAYGQNTRSEISPWDFDISFHNDIMYVMYYYDELYFDKAQKSKMYQKMSSWKSSICEFAEDIGKIVDLKDSMLCINAVFTARVKSTGIMLSDTSYMNLYDLALVLNGRYKTEIKYAGKTFRLDFDSIDEIIKYMNQALSDSNPNSLAEEIYGALEQDFAALSLEYKLSNIDQARAFAEHLESIDCFYTSRNVEYEMLFDFTKKELSELGYLEHERWMNEKKNMGWKYGSFYQKILNSSDNYADNLLELVNLLNKKNETPVSLPYGVNSRELFRHHKDMVSLEHLSDEDILKDTEPMRCMIKLLELLEGVKLYHK